MKKSMMKLFSLVMVFVLSFSFCRTVSFAHYSGKDSYWDKFSSDYYYRQMNKEQKELYDKLKDPNAVPYDPDVDGTGADDYGLTGTFTNEAGDTALFRVYNPNTWEHFYTTDVAERRSLILEGWNGEGVIGYFPTYASTDTDVMYRFRNPNTGDHHYTADMLEIVDIGSAGWEPEGTSFYSLKQGTGVPIYRLYNPNAVTGTHHYTCDKAEKDHLVSIGWKDEGISWYASSKDYYDVNKEEKGMDYGRLETALSAIREKTDFVPKVGLVLGSGLGGYAESGDMDVVTEVSYNDIPGFPVSTAPGHAGKYVFGYVGENKVPVVCMQGRVHYYEGYDMENVVLPIRLMGLMGADTIFLTNASGGINDSFSAGDLMLITDQISSFVPSPLRGENDERLGERFPDMSEIYDKDLRDLARKKAKELSIDLKEGVYIQTQGPNYESPAEIQFFKAIGADAVGMSTACEAIAANHMKKKIIGISCIANLAAGISETPLSGEEVIEAGKAAAPKFTALVTAIINDIK
ncbi:MAG: purine-nucleoside phosphorylase [Lachnospiraceae bacterium]|nr:purine-nucleoside phosphorylase [Lachnospiraceae bacterium]